MNTVNAVNGNLILWAFVVGLFGGLGWAIAHWTVAKLAALLARE